MATSTRKRHGAGDVTVRSDDATSSNGDSQTSAITTPKTGARALIDIPTLPFDTFKLAIKRLKAAGNLPHRIDRSAWSAKHFRESSELIVPAFRFLRLIDDEGRPLDTLTALIASFGTQGWRERLAEILRGAYSDLLAVGIEKVTPKGALEILRRSHGLDAAQARMAVAFFVHATRETELDVGPFMAATAKQSPQNSPMTIDKYRAAMLDRLPPFDASWGDDLKLAWFTAFNELASARSTDS